MLVKGDSCAKTYAGQAGDAVGPILYISLYRLAWREASRLRRANSAWVPLMPVEAPRTKRFDRSAAPRVSRAFTR